jgi:ribosomal protein S18 acetylase RimI-like enzyme
MPTPPVAVRPATPADRPRLRAAVVELQDRERLLHPTRLPGGQVADAYLEWMLRRAGAAGAAGAVLVAESGGEFAGFVAGWVEQAGNIGETPDSNRFGHVSDICVMPAFRGRRIAGRLLEAIEQHLRRAGVTRLRVNALAANAPARASYERAGFAPYEVLHEKVVVDAGGDA